MRAPMSRYSQLGRLLQLRTPLGEDALLLTGLRGQEGMSELYGFDLEMLAERPVAFEQILGQSARVLMSVAGSPARTIAGIISELSQADDVPGPTGTGTFIRYRARLVPHLWLLTQRVQSRVWQRKSVPDILRQVLHDEWQLNVQISCSGSFRPRNYCVQYRENDFAFLSRLMEEEGIGYCFEHKENGEQLVVSDLWSNRLELAAAAVAPMPPGRPFPRPPASPWSAPPGPKKSRPRTRARSACSAPPSTAP
jgi:type VI secretion system secreted protein VgrG